MLGLMFLMTEEIRQVDVDSHVQAQVLTLGPELELCTNGEAYQSLFALTGLLSSAAEGDTEWSLSQSIDSAFMSCPLAFMVALKSTSPQIQDKVLLLFGKYGQPTVLAEALWKLQINDEVGAFVRDRFSDFGLVDVH